MESLVGLNQVKQKRWWTKDTVAVVTGSNKGLGQAIVLHLARLGVTVVSTARDVHRGLAAVESAVQAEPELAGCIHFHQLDISDEQSVAEVAAWLQSTFGRIDILINNAALSNDAGNLVYEDAVTILQANYFGTKCVTEKLLPLLRASPDGGRIVMISSQTGLLRHYASNEYVIAKVAEAIDHLDKSIVDSLATKYLEDIKAGHATEKWAFPHHYKESKLFLNTYTRILAAEQAGRPEEQRILVTAICPGLVSSDMTKSTLADIKPAILKHIIDEYGSMMTTTEAATAPVRLALLPQDGYPHGQFFIKHNLSSTF